MKNNGLIAFMGIIIMAVMLMYPSVLAISYSDNTYGKVVTPTASPYTTINNTFINQTVNATVNTTQFDSSNPIHIKESWLTTFIEGISKWVNYYTKTEIDNLISGITVSQPIRLNVQYPTISYGEIYYLSKQNGTITKWDLRSSDSGSVNIVVYNSTTTKFTAVLSSASSNNSIVSVPVIDGEEILANITSVSGLDDFTLTMEVQ